VSFASQTQIDHLAVRIERAYQRRGARWNASCSTPRVWATAARILHQCGLDDPSLPVDPELYVAAQGIDPDSSDPWTELASPLAVDRYRRRVRSIVRQLRSELVREIRKAERSIHTGRPAAEVLSEHNPRLSPLGRYIVARRSLRADLAERWSCEALIQHRVCPLYREACIGLLPVDEYPREAEVGQAPGRSLIASAGSLN
jgi:hypothetical protein